MLTATIVHYWAQRRTYIPTIVEALKCGYMVPDEIIVWNNSGNALDKIDGCSIVESNRNWGPMARYAAAILASNAGGPPNYCMFQDDDLLVGRNTVSKALTEAACGDIIAAQGIQLNRGNVEPYTTGVEIKDGGADIVMRFILCQQKHLAEMYRYSAERKLTRIRREDDILLSMSNLAAGGKNKVVPLEFTNLDEHESGLCWEADHYRERNEMCRRLLDA